MQRLVLKLARSNTSEPCDDSAFNYSFIIPLLPHWQCEAYNIIVNRAYKDKSRTQLGNFMELLSNIKPGLLLPGLNE